MRFHSIRTRIAGIMIAAILITVVAVFIASISAVQLEVDQRAVRMMNLIADDAAKSVEKYLESTQQAVESSATLADETLDSAVLVSSGVGGGRTSAGRTAGQSAALDEYLKKYIDGLRVSFGSYADSTYGVISYFYCLAPEVSSNVHGFYYSKAGKTGFAEREPLVAGELDPSDEEHNAWYFTPIERGRPSWIGPYRSTYNDGMWLCSYVAPVYKAGTLIGVIGLDIPVDTLVSQLDSVKVYDTGFACLFDSEGHVIYHPELEIGAVPAENGRAFTAEQLADESSGNDLLIYKSNGTVRQMAYTTLSSGMKLAVTAPVSEINSWWTRLIRTVILITVVVVALFAALTFMMTGLITKPLEDLTAASQKLADGDYDVELDYDGNDELGVLTRSFTQMRDGLRKSMEDLSRRVYTDALTDLPNRRHFFMHAGDEKERLQKEGREPVMLYMDLIGMRHFNHQFGFREGDRLICEIGSMIERCFGRERMCRLGEDHFGAITSEDEVQDRLDELFAAIRGANGGNSLPLSVGIYPYSLEDVRTSIASDRAKFACDEHRGTYVSGSYRFDSGMLERVESTRYIISRFDQALSEKWIKVYYQPIVRASTGRVCDVEALSRWDDPEKGFLSPADFIPVLENARLLYRMDLYVLDRIIEKMKAQAAEGLPVVPHSLNLSRADFDSCDIVEEIRKRMDDAGIARDRLTVEITESIVGGDFEFMKEQVLRFRELGFKVWMDDFGSGYSTLDVLKDIRFDLIKFDMSFLRGLDDKKESRIILKEMAAMVNELGIESICEGVETAEQAEFLRDIGITKLQGYYFGRPVPFEEIVRMYRDGSHLGYEENA